MSNDINQKIELQNLQKLVDFPQNENQQLKNLPGQAGIDYSMCMKETVRSLVSALQHSAWKSNSTAGKILIINN